MKKFKKHIWAAIAFLLTLIVINIGLYILATVSDKKPDVFQILAVSIIITWILFLVAYYVWAISFYNINMGWTDEDWHAKSGVANASDDMSKATSVTPATAEPDENPNSGESLGLPPGTVRATIALSLLVAGLSMSIASFSMNNTYPLNSLFIDHFEFFKTGFLMMIAFYFGAKSLDILRNTSNAAIITKDENAGKNQSAAGKATPPKKDDGGAPVTEQAFNDPTARG